MYKEIIIYYWFFTDHVDLLKSDIASLEYKFTKLQEEKDECYNKLNILTKFFKEQEKEYLKYVQRHFIIYVY